MNSDFLNNNSKVIGLFIALRLKQLNNEYWYNKTMIHLTMYYAERQMSMSLLEDGELWGEIPVAVANGPMYSQVEDVLSSDMIKRILNSEENIKNIEQAFNRYLKSKSHLLSKKSLILSVIYDTIDFILSDFPDTREEKMLTQLIKFSKDALYNKLTENGTVWKNRYNMKDMREAHKKQYGIKSRPIFN